MTVKRCQKTAQITKIKHRINLTKHMTGRNPILKPKRVEELNLRSRQSTHHRRISSPTAARESRRTDPHEEFFHGIRDSLPSRAYRPSTAFWAQTRQRLLHQREVMRTLRTCAMSRGGRN